MYRIYRSAATNSGFPVTSAHIRVCRSCVPDCHSSSMSHNPEGHIHNGMADNTSYSDNCTVSFPRTGDMFPKNSSSRLSIVCGMYSRPTNFRPTIHRMIPDLNLSTCWKNTSARSNSRNPTYSSCSSSCTHGLTPCNTSHRTRPYTCYSDSSPACCTVSRKYNNYPPPHRYDLTESDKRDS